MHRPVTKLPARGPADRWQPLRRSTFIVLACYWFALFVGTHYPKAPELASEFGDKLLHFAAYVGLGFLVSANWSSAASFGRRQFVQVIALLALYGALDELSQIPVGRSCDWRDWCADVTGAVVGINLYLVASRLVGSIRRTIAGAPPRS